MKHLKSCAATVLALLAADAAFAATNYIKITGSSAFRGATTIAAYNLLDSTKTITGAYVESGKSMTGANRTILKGKLAGDISGDDYVIQMFWTGSVGGVLSLANNVAPSTPTIPDSQGWVSDATLGLTAVTKSGTGAAQTLSGGTQISSPVYEAASVADIAMSDSKQSTTAYSVDAGYPDLAEAKVGVIAFSWVKGSSADSAVQAKLANFTSISSLEAQQLFTSGLPLSQATGLAADSDVKVFPLGRDADSGTRVVAYAETGFGVFSLPNQYIATVTSGNVASIALYPTQTINGTSYALGQGGYASGGNVVTPLSAPVGSGVLFPAVGGKKVALVSYLGVNDAVSVLKANASASLLKWNGVALPYTVSGTTYTFDYTPITNGTYTYWSYEYVMENANIQGNGSAQDLFAAALVSQVTAGDAAVSGVNLSDMKVKRNTEGALIY